MILCLEVKKRDKKKSFEGQVDIFFLKWVIFGPKAQTLNFKMLKMNINLLILGP